MKQKIQTRLAFYRAANKNGRDMVRVPVPQKKCPSLRPVFTKTNGRKPK